MFFYYTTNRDIERDGFPQDCLNQFCAVRGDLSHVCFATAPVAGMGANVYVFNIAAKIAEPFLFENPFRNDGMQWYAIPHEIVAQSQYTKETYEAFTGQPWNKFQLSLKDTKDQRTSLLWVSRSGITMARIIRKNPIQIEVILDELFDPEKDYLILEDRWPPKGRTQAVRWKLNLLAGVMPRWGSFPWSWAGWVRNEQVRGSAITHLVNFDEALWKDITFATSKVMKDDRAAAWQIVANAVGRRLNKDIGDLPAKTETAVEAMLLRIAQAVPGWEPPIPKPEHEAPEHSGRVLLADERGTFPTTQTHMIYQEDHETVDIDN